jgi:hypothetical protein
LFRPEPYVEVRLRWLGAQSRVAAPRHGFGDRVMLAIAEAEPWRVVCSVARGWVLPLVMLTLLTSLWGAGAREVVGAAYASTADPLELDW